MMAEEKCITLVGTRVLKHQEYPTAVVEYFWLNAQEQYDNLLKQRA